MGVPTVAVSKSFFTSFAALPRNKQGRVTEFISKFCANPKAPGINCEKIQGAAEPDMFLCSESMRPIGLLLSGQKTAASTCCCGSITTTGRTGGPGGSDAG